MNTSVPEEQQPELAEHIGATIDFDKPWRMHGDVFNAARLPQDRDMVQCVVDVLARVGHPNPSDWTQDKDIQLAINMPPEGQIFLINRYWRLFLAEMPYDTMLQRRALMDQVASYSDYLNGFEVAVAPYVIPVAAAPAPGVILPDTSGQSDTDSAPSNFHNGQQIWKHGGIVYKFNEAEVKQIESELQNMPGGK